MEMGKEMQMVIKKEEIYFLRSDFYGSMRAA
jgi:hypothetical protein